MKNKPYALVEQSVHIFVSSPLLISHQSIIYHNPEELEVLSIVLLKLF